MSKNFNISPEDLHDDVRSMINSMKLYFVKRFYEQKFWEKETTANKYAQLVEGILRLESVAEHSWHVADSVVILRDHFPWLDKTRSLELALIHDKLEIYTGDFNPIGRDGKGKNTHAFNGAAHKRKQTSELEALDKILSTTRSSLRAKYRDLLEESIYAKSAEANFVKAVDKIQVLVYIYYKKQGDLDDRHLNFTFMYSSLANKYFPELSQHHNYLKNLIIRQVAERRNLKADNIYSIIDQKQLSLLD